MAARVWSVGVALKAAPVVAVLVGMGVLVAAPVARAPKVIPVSSPEFVAAERPPVLRRLRAPVAPFTKWCAAPSGVRVVAPCSATDSSYAGQPGSYSFTVSNPTPNDMGFHAVVTCAGLPTTVCKPETALIYVASDGGTAPVPVDWTTAADTTGSMILTVVLNPVAPATDTLTASVTVHVTIAPTITVSVRPHASAVEVTQPKDTSITFTVANLGTVSATYTLTRHCTGAVSCTGTMPGSVTVGAGSEQPVTVPINSGSAGCKGTVDLLASATGTADSGVVAIAPLSKAVAVSPAQESFTMPAGRDTAVTFTVSDVGQAKPVTYHLTRSCATPVTTCTGPDSVVVTSLNTPVPVRVAYHTASGTTGGTGGVTLVATATTGPTTDRSTGFARVTVPNTSDALYLTVATSPTAIERSACLTVAAGAGAFMCGDLLLTYALPGARSMAKARTPVLVYASQTVAAPGAAEFTLGVDVHLKSGRVAPTALTGTLILGALPGCAQSWTVAGWPTGGVRRVVARCTGLALTQAATALPFTLQLAATYADSVHHATLTGTAIVLARGASPFGAGWSLAGLEQLYFPGDTTQLLWVSGDGSARVYHRLGNTNSFVADSVDGPDSLTRNPTTLTWTRWAPGRLQIQFDSAGQHAATVNRLGQTTHFYWSLGHLDSLTVPPAAAHLLWHFTYTSGHLSSVTAPVGPSGARTVNLYQSQSPARVDSIRELDGLQVHFGYLGTSRLVDTVTDALGHHTTFTYGAANTLASVTVPTDASRSLVTSFLPGGLAGLTGGAVVDPATVVTKVIAPGADTTIVAVDRFGQPLTVRDPIGETTSITRGDTRWPALATRVTAPNGYTTAAAYDESGRMVTDTALAPFGGSNTITRYSYEPKFGELTRVVGPTGEVWRATYDTLTGERLADALTDTSAVHETAYRYDATCQLVRAVTAPLTPSDSVVYDTRCNPQTVTSPGSAVTRVLSDILGRVIRTTSPTGIVDTTSYDVMDRVVTTRTTGPTQNGVASQTVTVTMAYDALGRDTAVTRTMNPNPANLSALTTRTGFDWASRTVRETAPDGKVDSTRYNAVGDADKIFTRLGGTDTTRALTMTYDKLHRLRKRIVPEYIYPVEHIGVGHDSLSSVWRYPYPLYRNVTGRTGYTALADTAVFVYDSTGATAGRMTHANNGDAKVTRTYFANGAVATETDSVRTLKALGAGGGDLTHHIYTERYAYDLAGRLTTLVVPPQLAPRVQTDTLAAVLLLSGHARTVKDTVRYTYDTGANGTGALVEITGLLPGETFSYVYTPRGEVSQYHAMQMAAPDGPSTTPLLDTRTYTADGALRMHQVTSGSSTLLRAASYTVDAEGRVLTGSDSAQLGYDLLNPATMAYKYTGLGQLISTDYRAQSDSPYVQYAATESVTYDPLGNWMTRNNVDQWAEPYSGTATGGFSSAGTRAATYTTTSGRLHGDTLDGSRTDTLAYDAAGNLHATLMVNPGSPSQYTERVSYYALDGRLVAADARSGGGTYMVGHTAFEEYRYDALGRRVWVRARRWCSDQSGAGNAGDETLCDLSTVRRTVWSGSSELAEIQMPAADATPSDTIENDTLAVHRQRVAVMADAFYDANRFFGRVLYVLGPGLDQPVAVTRVNYADASDIHTGAVTYQVYAPFSLIGLWNNQGRVDRVVYGGTAAPGQTALCVDPGTQYRCAYPGIDWGEFPYLRPGQDTHTWQGTVLVDKPDATGTYYRRNRSYDPSTARFTQEDPLGLGGGLNVYGFNGGDPVNFSDPFGLCPGETARQERANQTQSGAEPCAEEAGLVNETPSAIDVAVFAAGVAPEEEATEKGAVVIGENMKDRVIPYAEKIGAKYYKAIGKRAENWMANNQRWIQRVMKAGKKVVDIGEDVSRAKRSPPYQMEKRSLEHRNYPVTKDPQPPSSP